MDETQRRVLAVLLVLLVPVSSLLGLARAMQEFGGSVFTAVWQANWWGDVVFTLGTVAAAFAAGWIALWFWRHGNPDLRPLAVLAVPASLLLHWAVYALSWSWTGPAFDGESHFLAWTFTWEGFGESWRWTWEWGWPGLVALAFLGPLPSWLALLAWSDKPAAAEDKETV